MSHYDCKNCGATMGIDWGSCESCTPKKYFELEAQLRAATCSAQYKWRELTRTMQERYIAKYTKSERDALNKYIQEYKL